MGQSIALDDVSGLAKILVVTAHPDDVDFGSGGSVATWVKAGVEVAYCVVTDGDAGGSDRSVSRTDMARIRQQEQRAAAEELGVSNVTYLGYPDGRLYLNDDLRRDICRVVRQYRPDRLVCQSPERNYQRIGASHPDHRVAGDAALCVAYPDARNPFAHPSLLQDEGLEPYAVKEVYLMASPQPNVAVDVTDVIELKLTALRRHESQVADEPDLDGRIKSWASASGEAAGLAPGRMAELFQVVVMPPSGDA